MSRQLHRYRNPYNPLNRTLMALQLVYLRWRMRAARDEISQLLQVWDWIPEQLRHHRDQVQRWDRLAQAIEVDLLNLPHQPQPASKPAAVATTLTPSDWAALR